VGQQGVEDITPPLANEPLPFRVVQKLMQRLSALLAVASEIELGFSPASKPAAQRRLPLCRRPERSPKGEATDSIAVVFACFYFSRFPPENRMSSPKTT
jgi:hypothetical protein